MEIRLSFGPASIKPGRKALRIPISLTEGSCFHIRTREPMIRGIGMGIGITTRPASRSGMMRMAGRLATPVVARNNLRCCRYSRVGVGIYPMGTVMLAEGLPAWSVVGLMVAVGPSMIS